MNAFSVDQLRASLCQDVYVVTPPRGFAASRLAGLVVTDLQPAAFFSRLEIIRLAGRNRIALWISGAYLNGHEHCFSGSLNGPGFAYGFRDVFRFAPSLVSPTQLLPILGRRGTGEPVMQAIAGSGSRQPHSGLNELQARALAADVIPVIWGVITQSRQILKRCSLLSRTWVQLDHAYIGRGHKNRTYRLSINGLAAGPVRACAEDRAGPFLHRLKPWRRSGSHIVVCPPSRHIQDYYQCSQWLPRTLELLRQTTDRPIRVRGKPTRLHPSVPLSRDLNDAHALVTHSSNAAVEAVIRGVPAFVDDVAAAAPVALPDLRRIEDPIRPDREAWLNHLCHSQYNLDEIRSGQAMRQLFHHYGQPS